MASNAKGEGGKGLLPTEQEREKEKDGRIKRLFCDVLRLRILAYIVSQPAAFVFIVSLFLIALCMPAIGRYVANADQLPDLFTMRVRNIYGVPFVFECRLYSNKGASCI